MSTPKRKINQTRTQTTLAAPPGGIHIIDLEHSDQPHPEKAAETSQREGEHNIDREKNEAPAGEEPTKDQQSKEQPQPEVATHQVSSPQPLVDCNSTEDRYSSREQQQGHQWAVSKSRHFASQTQTQMTQPQDVANYTTRTSHGHM